jgi:tetratricopeptide (TPR) repeat protein
MPAADADSLDTSLITPELIAALAAADVREEASEAAEVVFPAVDADSSAGAVSEDMTGTSTVSVSETAATEAGAESGGGPVTQDMIDGLLSTAEKAPAIPPLAAESNPPQEGGGLLLSQEDLDALVQQGQEDDTKRQTAIQTALEVIGQPSGPVSAAGESLPEPQPAEVSPDARKRRFRRNWFVRKPRPPHEPGVLTLYFRDNFLKVSSSLAALVVCSVATFTYLCMHQERAPDVGMLAQLRGYDLQRAVQNARVLMEQGDYQRAAEELDKAIAASQPSPERIEARFLRLDAKYQALPDDLTEKQAEPIHAEINDLVETARAHPRAADALRMKAKLYERVGILYGARDLYEEILSNYPSAEHLDAVLVDAAEVSAKLGKPKMAAQYLQHLLQQFPGSSYAGQAKLLLADAFAAAGNPDDARVLYIQTAQTQAGTPLGAEAFARLGKLDYDQGRYPEAIKQLQACLDMATAVVKGNDKVYLLLAQAYRAAGQPTEARRVLKELIDFFPETDVTPKALVELSRALGELGERKEALRVASQAAQRYSDDAGVLENQAGLLELDGETQAAGRTWLAAHEAGANNPDVLLAAARDFRKAAALEDALNAYDLLMRTFPNAAQAFEGGVEIAETRYEIGQVGEALDGLENLALATEGKPQRLPALMALGKMYRGLGLKERVVDVFGEVAALTTEPEVLAEAALALFEADATQEALTVARRVDPTKVKDATAYAVMTAQGKALLKSDPRKALEYMERAYETYPAQRTPDSDQALLDAYLATDNAARARALIMDLAARVARNPGDAPRLEKAALAWGDYLYERGDSRAAADAYAMAIGAGLPDSPTVRWAKYQRANALFKLSDFEGCVALFDEVAASDSPWANQATMMAEHARIEQQLRGLPVTPPRAKEG